MTVSEPPLPDRGNPAGRTNLAAELLVGARRGAPEVAALPPQCAPRNEAEAYAVQRAVQQLLCASIGGWKVSMLDAHTGTAAAIFTADIQPSVAILATSRPTGIEPEIAFRLAHDLPPLPRGESYGRDAVVGAVGSAHAAIEIVISRFSTHEGAPALDRLADQISNGGLVAGPAARDWQQLSLDLLPLRLDIDGLVVHESRGGHPSGDPLLPLIWLANHFRPPDRGLKSGDIVTTGSCAGLRYASPGAVVTATFTGLGNATLRLVDR